MERLDRYGISPRVGRRPLLVSAGALALAAVSGCSWLDRTPPDPDAEVHPDRPLLEAARDDEQALLTLVSATAQAHATLASLLDPMAQRCTTRLETLEHALADPASSEPATSEPATSAPSPGTTDTTGTSATPGASPTVPAAVPAARRHLVRATQENATRRTDACAEATDQGVARLLASVAAGHSQDVVLLRRGSRG